jgi:hypothetical protein
MVWAAGFSRAAIPAAKNTGIAIPTVHFVLMPPPSPVDWEPDRFCRIAGVLNRFYQSARPLSTAGTVHARNLPLINPGCEAISDLNVPRFKVLAHFL